MAGRWGGCPWSPCPGPGPALHPALELHQGALSLLGGWFWERLTPPLTAIPPPKTTKAKYKIPMYPYLLPKSTSTADQLPFTLPGGQCATVQVRLPVSTSPHPSLPFSPVPPPILRDLSAPLGSGATSYSLSPPGLAVSGPLVSGDFGEFYPQCLPTHHQGEPALSVHRGVMGVGVGGREGRGCPRREGRG